MTEFDGALLNELAARSGEPIVTDQDEVEARQALASVWELVLFYGSPKWEPDSCPGVARQVLIEASARLFMNLGGFIDERADAASLKRMEDFARGASLTDAEIARLERASGKDVSKGALKSARVVNYDQPVMRSSVRRNTGWVQPYGELFASNQAPIPRLPGDEFTNLGPYTGHFRWWW